MQEYVFKLGELPSPIKGQIFFDFWVINFGIICLILLSILILLSQLSHFYFKTITSPKMVLIILTLSFLSLSTISQIQVNQYFAKEIPLELYKEMNEVGVHNRDPMVNEMILSAKKDQLISLLEYHIIRDKYNSNVAQVNTALLDKELIEEKMKFLD